MAFETMFAGDTKHIVITVTDADSGEPVNLTGATVRFAMAKSAAQAAVVEKATGGEGIVLTTPESGVFTVTLDPEDTENLSGGYYYEAEVTDDQGNVSTVATGRVTIGATLIVPE